MLKSFFLFSLLFLFIYSCATRKILRDGKLVPYNQVLKDDFQKCERAKLENRTEDAKKCLIKFISEFKDSTLIDDAHYILGGIYYSQNDFQNAITNFKTIVTTYDFSDLLEEASFSLASCYYQTGDYKKSYIVLSKIDKSKVTRTLRLKIYYLLAKNAQLANANYTAMIWYLRARELTSQTKNIIKINNEVIKLIEEKLTKSELLSIADKYQNKFPSTYINYKLGKDFYKDLRPDQAKHYLSKLMDDKDIDMLESKYVNEAGDLLARIDSHKTIYKNRIGVILPLSGEFESFGKRALRGIELAAGVYNNKSSAFEPELFIVDSKNDPTIATNAVTKLLFEDHVAAIVGPLLSSTASEVAQACEKLGIPHISLSQKQGIPETGEFSFRLALTNSLQIKTLVSYATQKLGIQRFAILHPNDEYGRNMSDLFWTEVLKYGGEITNIESYLPKQTDFKNEMAKISDRFYIEPRLEELNLLRAEFENLTGRKPRHGEISLPPNIDFEAIFIPSFPKDIGQIAPSLSYADIEGITLLGTNGWNSPGVINRGGEYIEGAIFVDGFFNNSPYSIVRDFSTTFYNTFNTSPEIIEAHAFDATDILISLLSQPDIDSRFSLQKAISNIRDFPGVTGSISFSETGDAEKPLFMLSVENERIIQIN